MARATYVYLVVLLGGRLVPFTVKHEMINYVSRGASVDKVLRLRDGDPSYDAQIMPESEWRV